MSLSTSFRNIKIKDNLVDLGYASTGTAAVNYTYASNLLLAGDALVQGNTFGGTIGNGNAGTTATTITSGSCIVTDNIFIRGSGSPITAYIAVTSATDQVITTNIFDQPTVDGTTDILVSGLSTRSIYRANKNQTSYATIPISSGVFTSDTTNGSIETDASSTVSAGFNYLSIFINTTANRQFYINFNISPIIPESARLVSAKIGIFNIFVGSAALSNGTISLELDVQDVVTANYTTAVNSILDVKNRSSSLAENLSTSLDLAINLAASQANTLYLTLDTSLGNSPDNFISGKDKCMNLQVYFSNTLSVLGGGMDWNLSPIVLKYIWA